MRRSQFALLIALAACVGAVLWSVLWRRTSGPSPMVGSVSTVGLTPDGEPLTVLDQPEHASAASDALDVRPATRTAIASVREAFDLGKYRSQTIERLHSRFVATRQDTDDEWQAGYMLMQTALLAHLDHTGGFTDGGGKGFLSTGNDPDSFRTYSDGREYVWRKCDYPELAELTTLRFEEPSPGKRLLTVPQRQAVADLYVLARSELARK